MTTSVVEAPTPPQTGDPKVIVSKSRTLNAYRDRCGALTRVLGREKNVCGAEAYVHITYPADLVALRCAHHATEQWDQILAHAVEIHDERSSIYTDAPVSSY